MIDSLKASIMEERRQIDFLQERIRRQEKLIRLLELNPEVAQSFSDVATHVMEQYGIQPLEVKENTGGQVN